MTGQMTMPATVPGSYWVRVTGHRVWPDGARFLVVEERDGGWLLCWRDGVRPQPEKRLGVLLKQENIEELGK